MIRFGPPEAPLDAGQALSTPVPTGYQRLRFFGVQLWQLAGLALVLMVLVLYLFPHDRTLITFFEDRGLYPRALGVLTEMLREAPDDPALLLAKARLQQLQGRPDQAIRTLEFLVARHPDHVAALRRLAQHHEWNRRPRSSLRYWAALARADPRDIDALQRLIGYYRYLGQVEEEVAALVRLVNLEKRLPADALFGLDVDRDGVRRVLSDPLFRALTRELRRLVQQRLGDPDPVLLDELLRGLYAVRYAYRSALVADDRAAPPDRQSAAIQSFEAFIRNGMALRGRQFATDLDHFTQKGVDYRLLFSRALRWNDLAADADMVLGDLLREFPDDRRILRAQVESARAGQDPSALVAAYEALVRAAPDDTALQTELADLLLAVGRTQRAYGIYLRLIRDRPADRSVLEKLLAAAVALNRPAPVRAAADLVLGLRPDDDALKRMAAQGLVAVGAFEPAVALLLDLRQRQPHDTAVLRRLAELYQWTQRPDLALDMYLELAAVDGGTGDTLDRILTLAAAVDDRRRGQAAFRLLRRLRPHEMHLIRQEAAWREARGDLPGAVTALESYLVRAPGDDEARRRLAQLYSWTGRPAAAYGIYRALARQAADRATVDQLLALAAQSGQVALVREAALLALALRPRDTDLPLAVAGYLRDAGDLPGAIALLESHLVDRPQDEAARSQMAELMQWNGQTRAAARQLGTLSDAAPQDAQRARQAAEAYLAAEDVETARRFWERAVARSPADDEARSQLAEIYGWLGQGEAQLVQMRVLASHNALPERLWPALARVLVASGEGRQALALLEPVAIQRPLPPEAGLLLAQAYRQTGRRAAADRILNVLAAENAQDARRLADLGHLALGLDDIGAAGRFFDLSLARDPRQPLALKGSAQVLAWNNAPGAAMARFEAYNRVAPRDYEARYQLGELYWSADRRREAMVQYRRTLRLIQAARKQAGAQSAPR